MPLIIKQKVAPQVPAAPLGTPFEGGNVVLYDKDDLLADLKTIDQARDKRDALKEAVKKAQDALSEFNMALAPVEDNVTRYVCELNGLAPGADFDGLIGNYHVSVGKQATKRTVTDVRAVHKIMGDDVFYKLATVPLKEIDAYLTMPEREKVIVSTFTEGRKLQVSAVGGGTVAFTKKKGKV